MLRRSKRALIFLFWFSSGLVLLPDNVIYAATSSDQPILVIDQDINDTSRFIPAESVEVAADSAASPGDTTGSDSIILEPLLFQSNEEDSRLIDNYVARDSVIAAESPTITMFKSVVFPGWGQYCNKKYMKAGVVFAIESYLIYESIYFAGKASDWRQKWKAAPDELKSEYFAKYTLNRDRRNSNIWYTGVVVFLSMFDAYVDAHLQGFPDKKAKQEGLSWDVEPGKEMSFSVRYNF